MFSYSLARAPHVPIAPARGRKSRVDVRGPSAARTWLEWFSSSLSSVSHTDIGRLPD
jgi:hypothetical protein